MPNNDEFFIRAFCRTLDVHTLFMKITTSCDFLIIPNTYMHEHINNLNDYPNLSTQTRKKKTRLIYKPKIGLENPNYPNVFPRKTVPQIKN
jgi:hypothetical protein